MLLCSELGHLRSHLFRRRQQAVFGVSNGHKLAGTFRYKLYREIRCHSFFPYGLSRCKPSCSVHVTAAISSDGQLASSSQQAASHQALSGSSRVFGCNLLRAHRPPAGQRAFRQYRCKLCARASARPRAGVRRLIKRQDRHQAPFKLVDPEVSEQVKPRLEDTAEQQTPASKSAERTCSACGGRRVQIVDGETQPCSLCAAGKSPDPSQKGGTKRGERRKGSGRRPGQRVTTEAEKAKIRAKLKGIVFSEEYKKSMRVPKVCSYCGEPRHNRKGCPKLHPEKLEQHIEKRNDPSTHPWDPVLPDLSGPLWGLEGVQQFRVPKQRTWVLAWPMPVLIEEAVQQAAEAVKRAQVEGIRRQKVEIMLPQTGALSGQGSWPGGIRQQAQFAVPKLIEPLLRDLKKQETFQGRMTAEWLDESDCVGAWQNENLAAIMFPTADALTQVRNLARVKGPQRTTLLINPQWQTGGQIVSDFGFGQSRSDADKFVASFRDIYCLERINVQGDDLRLLKAYPGNWQVFYTWPNGRGFMLIGDEKQRPSYFRLIELLSKVPNARSSRSWFDKVLNKGGTFEKIKDEFVRPDPDADKYVEPKPTPIVFRAPRQSQPPPPPKPGFSLRDRLARYAAQPEGAQPQVRQLAHESMFPFEEQESPFEEQQFPFEEQQWPVPTQRRDSTSRRAPVRPTEPAPKAAQTFERAAESSEQASAPQGKTVKLRRTRRQAADPVKKAAKTPEHEAIPQQAEGRQGKTVKLKKSDLLKKKSEQAREASEGAEEPQEETVKLGRRRRPKATTKPAQETGKASAKTAEKSDKTVKLKSDAKPSAAKQGTKCIKGMTTRGKSIKGAAKPNSSNDSSSSSKVAAKQTRSSSKAAAVGKADKKSEQSVPSVQGLSSSAEQILKAEGTDAHLPSETDRPLAAYAVARTADLEELKSRSGSKHSSLKGIANRSIDGDEDGMLDRFGSVDIVTKKRVRDLKMDPILQLASWRESIFGSKDSVSESIDMDDSVDSVDK